MAHLGHRLAAHDDRVTHPQLRVRKLSVRMLVLLNHRGAESALQKPDDLRAPWDNEGGRDGVMTFGSRQLGHGVPIPFAWMTRLRG